MTWVVVAWIGGMLLIAAVTVRDLTGLLAWIAAMFILTGLGLWLARRWLDEQDRTGGPP